MLELLDSLADFLEPYAAVISAVATLGTAVIAILALGSTARDSRERSRPLIFPSFREAEHSDTTFELIVKNYGASTARDLRVAFDPPFNSEARADGLTGVLAQRYDAPIPLLPPGSELTNTWWAGGIKPGSGNELVNHMSTPDEVVVTVSYKGNRLRRYRDVFPLTADTIKLKTSAVSSNSIPGRIESIQKSIKTLADESRATSSALRDIGRRLPAPEYEDDAPPSPKIRRSVADLLAILRPGR